MRTAISIHHTFIASFPKMINHLNQVLLSRPRVRQHLVPGDSPVLGEWAKKAPDEEAPR
jgi:hypothetical protein